MRATARTYWRLLMAGFRRQSAYRLAALGGLVANLTFGLLKVAVLFATVRAAGGQLHGYTTASMSTYVWLSQGPPCCWRSPWSAATPRSRGCTCGPPGCSSSCSTARR